jgi:hypothetical protein
MSMSDVKNAVFNLYDSSRLQGVCKKIYFKLYVYIAILLRITLPN